MAVEDRWIRKDKTRTPLYGKGLRWRAVWEPPGSAVLKRSFATKDAATAHLAAVTADIHRGVYVAPRKRVLLRDYAAAWEAQQIHQRPSSQGTIRRRLGNDVIPSLGAMVLQDIRRQDVQLAVMEWAARLAASTVKLSYGYFASMMKAAVFDGLIAASPCVQIRLPKDDPERIVPLSTATVQAIVTAIPAPYKPLVVFGAATGMRSGEMRGLIWDRIDFGTGMVTIDRQLTGNNSGAPAWGPPKTPSSVRSIHIGPDTVKLLQGLSRDGIGGLVFHSAGRSLTRNAASEAWRDARKTVPGIGKGYHQLRHYHASRLIAAGMSPVAVAHRLGHKDVAETLATYAHLWPDDDTRAAALTDGDISLSGSR